MPELLALDFAFTTQQISSCKYDEPWLMNWRGLATYTIPKIDVLVSATGRSTPNVQPDAGGVLVAHQRRGAGGQLQRLRAGLAAKGQTRLRPAFAVPGGQPGAAVPLFGERVNSLDMRFGKILRFGSTRTNVAIDLYNMFNSNVGTAFNQGFGADGATWLRPTAVLNPRFVRFNVTFDF